MRQAAPATAAAPAETAERAYLDHAATTALRPAAREAFLAASAVHGNPSSTHTSGRRARAVLDEALETIAGLFGVPRSWVLMTSGGTEADNLALRAVPLGVRDRDPSRTAVAVAATDHPAVVATARALPGIAPGLAVRELTADSHGLLRADDVERALADRSVSVLSAALVNNETGAHQDLTALAELARGHGTLLHTDAVQAVGQVPLPAPAQAPLMSVTGHKIGAPVGVGALIADPAVPFAPLSTGGGQQREVRSGTLDAPLAAAFAAALTEALTDREAENRRVRSLAGRLRAGIARIDPRARFTLPEDSPQSGHIVHVLFPGADSDSLLFLLDQRGVDCSAGSACAAGVVQASPVLAAMGYAPEETRGALRLSLGWTSTVRDVDALLAALPDALERSRAVGALHR